MGKLFWQISTTLDGFMEGPDGSLKRTAEFTDPDFDRYASEMLNSIGGMLLGRKTYELFVDHWPKAEGADAGNMNRLPKYVFSHTLESVAWDNAQLVKGDVAAEVSKLKNAIGSDLAVFGSAGLASSLAELGLIDEYRILITPFKLGKGGGTFKNTTETELKLTRSEEWRSGTVALWYEPVK